MTRIFLDGIQPSAMPASYPGLAGVIGYTDGNWPDYQALVARYPGLVHVSCTITASVVGAVILDVEQGDATPQEAPGWVSRSRVAGIKGLTVYCNYSTWPLVQAQFTIQKVAPPLYGIARYDGVEEIPIGAIYKQFKNTAGYDVNVVADYWPGVDPDPKPVPGPPSALSVVALTEETSVQIEPLSVHPGEYAMIVPPNVGSFAVAADGYGAPGASLRIVLWHNDVPSVLGTITVGGSSGHHYIGHQLAGADAVTVRRLDSEAYPVALGFRS